MTFTFEKYVQKSNAFIQEVARELGNPQDTDRAYRVTRAVLHSLRDNLPVSESLHLLAQLPFLMKAVYVDNWTKQGNDAHVRHLDAFVKKVRNSNAGDQANDFPNEEEVEKAIHAVFRVLKKYVTRGEIEDVLNMLPAEIRPLMA